MGPLRFRAALPDWSSPLALSRLAAVATASIGAVEAYALRSFVDASAAPYPGMAATVASGHVGRGLLDGYWQPLWPLLLALPRTLVASSPEDGIILDHVIAALCLAASCALFHRFVRELIGDAHRRDAAAQSATVYAVSGAWATFAFLTLRWAHPGELTPDPLAGCLVILAGLILLRIARGSTSARVGAGLAAVLVAAFLTSPSLVCLLVAAAVGVAFVTARRGARRVGLGFLLVAFATLVPYGIALSVAVGRPTLGESARYVEAWEVDGLVREHWWAGQVTGYGAPAHPPRIIAGNPLTLAFVGGPRGSGAPPFESTWWNAGLDPRVDLTAHMHAVRSSLSLYADLFPGPFLKGAILLFLAAVLLIARWRNALDSLRRSALLVLPMLAVPVALLPVDTQPRMVAMPIAVATAVLLMSAGRRERTPRRKRWGWIVIAALAVFAVKQPISDLYSDLSGDPLGGDQLAIARTLESAGLRRGAAVASIDRVNAAGFVALGDYQVRGIVVSVADWEGSDDAGRVAALQALRGTGVRAVIAPAGPDLGAPWRRVGATDYVVLLLGGAE